MGKSCILASLMFALTIISTAAFGLSVMSIITHELHGPIPGAKITPFMEGWECVKDSDCNLGEFCSNMECEGEASTHHKCKGKQCDYDMDCPSTIDPCSFSICDNDYTCRIMLADGCECSVEYQCPGTCMYYVPEPGISESKCVSLYDECFRDEHCDDGKVCIEESIEPNYLGLDKKKICAPKKEDKEENALLPSCHFMYTYKEWKDERRNELVERKEIISTRDCRNCDCRYPEDIENERLLVREGGLFDENLYFGNFVCLKLDEETGNYLIARKGECYGGME